MVRVLVVGLFVALALAGCTGGKSAPDASEDAGFGFDEEVEVQVTDTTGAIRGVVVDEAIRPVAGALVVLVQAMGDRNFTTGDSGSFAFSGLDSGTYFLEVSRFGYSSVQQSVDVVAGQRDPPVVKVQLASDPTQVAYVTAQAQVGYIMCQTSIVAVCGAPNVAEELLLCPFFQVCPGPITPDRYGLYFYYEANATLIQSEMVWQSTQPATPELTLSLESLGAADDVCPPLSGLSAAYGEGATGGSPIHVTVDEEEVERAGTGPTCPLFHSVFSGGGAGTPVGATVEQRFEIFSHSFYGFTPPEGWVFSANGTPVPPT